MNVKTVFVGLGTMAALLTASAKDVDVSKLPAAATKKDVTFAKDIKPIFEKSCVKCHGAEKPKARLRLDNLEGSLKGSSDGKVIEPGNSAKSSLVHSVARLGDEDYWMPPPKNKDKIPALTAEQVGLIRAWIDQGAK
ncbi:MAG: c-type cytochrome [Verrucomicrobia bacterium]|nr:c-type cytochrome [Verrucomicrobiota bacterium]